MIPRKFVPRPRRLAILLPAAVLILAGSWLPPAAHAQKPTAAAPTPGVVPASTAAVTPAPTVSPAPGFSLSPPGVTPTPGTAMTPDPLDTGASALPLDAGATAPGPPLITGGPLLAPTPHPTLAPATTTQLDNNYGAAVAAQIPTGPHEGLPVSLLQAVRTTLSNNTQVLLSGQDAQLSRSFLQQNTGVFDSHVLFNGTKTRITQERSPAEIRMDYQTRRMKAQLAAQFLQASARLQADLNHSIATNTPPQQDYTTGNNSTVSSQNGVLSSGTVTFLDQTEQNLDNAQKQQQDAFTALITQIATQNATPAQVAQLQALQQQNITLEQQTELQFITAFQKVGSDLQNSLKMLVPTAETANSANYTAGVSKIFRNGISIEPTAGWTQQGVTGGPPVNRAKVGVQINVPLLRGLGEDATGAPERAAAIDYEASQLTTRHTVTQSVFQTTQLYWAVVAAQRRVDLLRQSRQVSTSLLDLSGQLVKADEMAPADIYVIAARTNDTAIQVYSAELALLDAQQQLALQIGVDPEKMATPLSPSDGFLEARSPESVHDLSRDALLRMADGRRADLLAARKLQASGKVLTRAAQLNLKPLLNFSLNVSWSAVNEGSHYEQYIEPFATSYNGPSVMGSVVFDWPVANNTQRGLLNQARATLAQRNINTVDLQRAVASGVVFSLGSVENALQQLQDALTARTNYRKSLDAVYAKLKAGNSTFLDAVETEVLYTNSGLNVINAQQQYASSLARVRYETGTLVPPAADSVIGWDELTTLPTPAVDPTTARLPKLIAPVTQGKSKGR